MIVRGCQTPRIRCEPKRAYTDGDDAATLAKAYGLDPDPWQRLILDSWLGRDEFDHYTSSRAGVLVARQNGKNAILEIRELYGTAILGEKVLHTAHEVKTARKAFLRVASFFENAREYPELAALVTCIRRTNGQEAIVLNNGGSIEFSARSKGAARGFTVDVVICDEAQFLTDEQLEALMPTMAAAPLGNPQLIMVGTPPKDSTEGEVYGRMRRDGIDKSDPRLSWHEWSIEDYESTDMSDHEVWAACNPALGIRLDMQVIEDEYRQMSKEGFARERLSMWFDVSEAERPIKADEWAACATESPQTEGKTAYAVKFSADGATASLAVAVRPDDGGPVHVELIEHRSMSGGVGWLVDWLVPRMGGASTVAIDGLHWSGSLVEKLRSGGVRAKLAVTVAGSKDVVSASSMMLNAIESGQMTHYDQPALNSSALGASKRQIGSGGGFAFGGDDDSTPIEAATLAHWAVLTCKRNPRRHQTIL